MAVEREAWIREHGAGVTPQSWQPGVTMLRDLLAEVDALRAALAAAEAELADTEKHAREVAMVLCDRVHASTIYIGANVGLNDFHEDASQCVTRNMKAVNATRDLAQCDRSHERWELEAQARLREIIADSERRAREACAAADRHAARRNAEKEKR